MGEYIVGLTGAPRIPIRHGDRTMLIRTTALATTAFAATALLAGGPALGQNLSDRIDHVMQKRAEAQTHNSSRADLLSTLVYTDISVQFNDQPARDVMKYLQTVLGINIVA